MQREKRKKERKFHLLSHQKVFLKNMKQVLFSLNRDLLSQLFNLLRPRNWEKKLKCLEIVLSGII